MTKRNIPNKKYIKKEIKGKGFLVPAFVCNALCLIRIIKVPIIANINAVTIAN